MKDKLVKLEANTKVYNIKDALVLSKQLKTLRAINAESPKDFIAVTKVFIVRLCEFFNEQWSDQQINDSLSIIQTKCYYLTHADLKVFVRQCMEGKFELKFRFMPNVLMEWLDLYLANRASEAVNLQKYVPAEITPLSDKAKEVISELKAKFEPVKEIEVKVNPTPFESKVNEYLREFDKIFKQQWQPKEKEDMIRTIEVEGKQLTKEQFIKYKIYES